MTVFNFSMREKSEAFALKRTSNNLMCVSLGMLSSCSTRKGALGWRKKTKDMGRGMTWGRRNDMHLRWGSRDQKCV